MSTNTDRSPSIKTPARKTRHLPPGHRVLHVTVPEKIFNAAKAKALLLGIDWPHFVVQLLKEADPRNGDILTREVRPTLGSK